jgi:hypothetical protein
MVQEVQRRTEGKTDHQDTHQAVHKMAVAARTPVDHSLLVRHMAELDSHCNPGFAFRTLPVGILHTLLLISTNTIDVRDFEIIVQDA